MLLFADDITDQRHALRVHSIFVPRKTDTNAVAELFDTNDRPKTESVAPRIMDFTVVVHAVNFEAVRRRLGQMDVEPSL